MSSRHTTWPKPLFQLATRPPPRYAPPEVDAVRQRKLTDLDNFRKEQAAAAEAARKKALMAKAQAAEAAAAKKAAAGAKKAPAANGGAPKARSSQAGSPGA